MPLPLWTNGPCLGSKFRAAGMSRGGGCRHQDEGSPAHRPIRQPQPAGPSSTGRTGNGALLEWEGAGRWKPSLTRKRCELSGLGKAGAKQAE